MDCQKQHLGMWRQDAAFRGRGAANARKQTPSLGEVPKWHRAAALRRPAFGGRPRGEPTSLPEHHNKRATHLNGVSCAKTAYSLAAARACRPKRGIADSNFATRSLAPEGEFLRREWRETRIAPKSHHTHLSSPTARKSTTRARGCQGPSEFFCKKVPTARFISLTFSGLWHTLFLKDSSGAAAPQPPD